MSAQVLLKSDTSQNLYVNKNWDKTAKQKCRREVFNNRRTNTSADFFTNFLKYFAVQDF